ncbi:MAG: GNAT family N-acetyltransferase [Candidatus Hodarchaeales archaeon]|jgi:RimJ/RimL family protein N-acetyltransferase
MTLEGKSIILREQRESDLQHFIEMKNTLETQGWSKTLPPDHTIPMFEKSFRKRELDLDPKEGKFVIEEKITSDIVGIITYTDLERRFSTTIGIITFQKYWGKGYALDAQEVLLKFLFHELGVRVVRLWTHSGNVGMVKLAQKSGFIIAGRLRENIYKNGQLFDNLLMDLLREEYYERHPELKDSLPSLEFYGKNR